MTKTDADMLIRVMAPVVREYVQSRIDPLVERLKSVEIVAATKAGVDSTLDVDQLGDIIVSAIKEAIDPIRERIQTVERENGALRARLKTIEDVPLPRYEGVYDAEKTYTPGAFVSHQGSVWHASLLSTGLVPSANHAHWRLAVKAGRDGKDMR